MSNCGKIILKRAGMYCCTVLLCMYFTFALTQSASAQVIGSRAVADSAAKIAVDSLNLKDTTQIKADTSTRASLERRLGVRLSKDALPAPVKATAVDSAVLNMEKNLFHLYGDAKIKYQETELDAGMLTYDQSTNLITATTTTVIDSTSSDTAKIVKPTFLQGQEKFTYDWLQYNFKSKRAIVRNARSQYGEGFVHSDQVKRNPDESIYGYKSIYTTCALDTPHFGIRARKIKVIPDRIIVSGAANLTIQNVPTPLYLPFGVFPITQSQRSGFQLPSYTLEERRGLGLTNLGYYFYLNDHVDLLVLTNIYSKGSYNLSLVSSYSQRYQYTGGFSFNYGYEKIGEVYDANGGIQRSYDLRWRHATDPKAKPGRTLNATVNIQKNNYSARNSYNPNEIIQNQYQSNITYSKTWQGKPFGLTAALLHEQNTLTKLVNVTLPQLNFYISQINPFQRKNAVGSAKWYEKITASYTVNALARTSFYDTAFRLNTLSLNDFNYGMAHKVPVSAAYTIFRYINLSFNIDYNEYWLTQKLYRYYNNNDQKIDSVLSRGFYATRDASASMQLSTRIYGIKQFKKGKISGIRHVLTPNIGLNYTPDYAAPPFQYYYRTYLDAGGNMQYLSPYEGSVVGTPGSGGTPGTFRSTINYGIGNTLQMKVRSKKDTATGTKIINLIDGLSFGGDYNFAADSFKWSIVGASFRTNILNIINISANASFDPYKYDYDLGRRVNITGLGNGGGLRFNNATVSLGATFRSKESGTNNTKTRKSDEFSRMMRAYGYDDYVDFKVPWSLNVSYALGFAKIYRPTVLGRDTLQVTNNDMQISGDVNITSRWKLAVRSGYNFTTKQLAITSIDIYRDLHCWEMRLGTIPFGPQKNYNFTLNVKASILQDLRLLRRRDYRDVL
jgi:hypothetical protein